jgi:hypothetical protein
VFHNGLVLEALGQLRSVAIRCADTPAWPLSDSDLVACVDAVQAAEQALAAVKLHLIRQVDARDLPRAQHATSCAGWLRSRLRIRPETTKRWAGLAAAVDRRPDLDQALTAGAVNLEQAVVIDDCLSHLPAQVGGEAVAKAEAMLIGWAAQFDPRQLKSLADRILLHIAPEVAEVVDAAALARAEARAHESRTLTVGPPVDGRVRVAGWLDVEAAAIVSAALDPLCAPRTSPLGSDPSGADPLGVTGQRRRDTVVADDRTPGQRRADALVEVCRLVLNTGDLPVNGGDRPQLTITVPFDVLRGELGVGTLDTGERLTPTQTRRLACDAHLLPAVLGSDGQVLDVGQSRRLITGALRRALVTRDRGCAFPGCDRPPRWCDGHHIRSWTNGGPTSLDNAVLLCGPHHRTVHHSDWQVRLGRDRLPDFIPPAHLDLHQRPRRNIYHRRT